MNTEENGNEFDPFAAESEKARGNGTVVAWLALGLAVIVAGFTAWQWWLAGREANDRAALQAALTELRAGQTELDQRLSTQAGRLNRAEQSGLDESLQSLQRRVEEIGRETDAEDARLTVAEQAQADTLARLESVESGLAALVVRGETPARALELAEVEYLLRAANERLHLYDDPRTADRALALADAQLQAVDDPLYVPVRQAIAAARLSLENMDAVDTVALTERLAGAQRDIPGLPFPGEDIEPESATPDDADSPGIWQRFKSAVAGLVTVRRQTPDTSLLAIGDKDYLRQALWLQLETARLAVMRRDQIAWRDALGRAIDTLDGHFDGDSDAVADLRRTLRRLRGEAIEADVPDLSAPWAQLQRLRQARPADDAADSPAAPASDSEEETGTTDEDS